jgi:hypothetical protein
MLAAGTHTAAAEAMGLLMWRRRKIAGSQNLHPNFISIFANPYHYALEPCAYWQFLMPESDRSTY